MTAQPQNEQEVASRYPRLVHSAETRLAKELLWAHKNIPNPAAANVIKGCARWEEALAKGIYSSSRTNRRALCQLDGIRISCSPLIETNTDQTAALQHIRELLATQIKSNRQTLESWFGTSAGRDGKVQHESTQTKSKPSQTHKQANSLETWFRMRAPHEGRSEIEEAKMPDIATDVSSTYHRLRVKMRANADDEDLAITTKALYQLRSHVNRKSLRALTQEPKRRRKTIRRAFSVTDHVTTKLD